MNLDQAVSPAPHVIAQELAGETLLTDLQAERYFGLDSVGTRIWQLITEKRVLGDIVSTLLEEYEVDEARLLTDLEALLDDVNGKGLVTLADDDDT